MDKISSDDVANTHELPLLSSLECPIDNMISMNPVVCEKCETIYCSDCADSWKKRSNICPMCKSNPFEVIVNLDKHILKDQISKIKFSCSNQIRGCLTMLPSNEIDRHAKICDYRTVRCEKCSLEVPFITMASHHFEQCTGNRVKCLICREPFNLNSIRAHLQSCSVEKLCGVCSDLNPPNHISDCILRVETCDRCGLAEISPELQFNSHRCVNTDMQQSGNLSAYFKCVLSRAENNMRKLLSMHEERFKEFNTRLQELTSDLIKKESQEYSQMEVRLNKANEDSTRKMLNLKKDKLEQIKRIHNEINELNDYIKSKNN
jgi:hypothetical protein